MNVNDKVKIIVNGSGDADRVGKQIDLLSKLGNALLESNITETSGTIHSGDGDVLEYTIKCTPGPKAE